MTWSQVALAAAGSAAAASRLAAVSRTPAVMEIWWVASDGSVQGASYDASAWSRYELAPAGSASVTGGIAAVSRMPTTMEVWWIGPDESVQGAYWYGSDWGRYELALPGSAALTSSIAAVSRMAGTMELWWAAPGESVRGAFWYGEWGLYELAPDSSASTSGGIAAVSRKPTTMELWFTGSDGSVQGASWQGGGWSRYELAPAGRAALTSSIAAVSRIPASMEVWYIAPDESVHDCAWYEGGIGWAISQLAGPDSATLHGGHLAAVSRIPTSMELWYVTPGGAVAHWYWYQGGAWATDTLAHVGSATLQGGIAVLSRAPLTMELWFVGHDGAVLDEYWYGPVVAAPASGLNGNSNYLVYSNCAGLAGVSVTLEVTQDIVGSAGFGIQLNAYSGTSDFDGAQQYVVHLDPSGPRLMAQVDNWQNPATQLINTQVPLATLPSRDLPAGYQLTIALANDSGGNVSAATYTLTDPAGVVAGAATITLLSVSGVTAQDLAPITAFQVNLVGFGNGAATTLSSGAGKITYAASVPLIALSTEPSCVAWSYSTVENSNSTYGVLTADPSTILNQSFQAGAAQIAAHRRVAAVDHVTRVG